MKSTIKSSIWRGVTALLMLLFVVSIFGGIVANANAGGINNFLGISAATKPTGDGRSVLKAATASFPTRTLPSSSRTRWNTPRSSWKRALCC